MRLGHCLRAHVGLVVALERVSIDVANNVIVDLLDFAFGLAANHVRMHAYLDRAALARGAALDVRDAARDRIVIRGPIRNYKNPVAMAGGEILSRLGEP